MPFAATSPFCILIVWCGLYFGLRQYERQARVEALARQAELRTLRHQLTPHFLCNTLNGISTLVGEGHAQEARRMIARLGDFLRATLDGSGSLEVSLAQEISYLEQYLAIEQARLGERLGVEIAVAPEVLDASVPNLLLQPLVENAVQHGVTPFAAGGDVSIRAERQEDARLSDGLQPLPSPLPDAPPAIPPGIQARHGTAWGCGTRPSGCGSPTGGGQHGMRAGRGGVLDGDDPPALPCLVERDRFPANMSAAPIRVLIVDDEPLARRGVRVCLAAATDVEVVAECAGGEDAVEQITRLAPDLVFLDVQMPGLDGFGVLARVPPERWPLVIFLTAHEQHALRAFDAHALDYLLKPVDDDRFAGRWNARGSGCGSAAPARRSPGWGLCCASTGTRPRFRRPSSWNGSPSRAARARF